MTEETMNVAEEIQNEEVIHPTTEKSKSQSIETNSQKQDDKEYNFAQLRKGKEQLEKRLNDLQEYVSELEAKNSKSNSEEDSGIDDDDLVEGKHFKKVTQQLKQLQDQLRKEQTLSTQDRLLLKFNDFDSVVTKDNIEKLKTTEPELYTSIISSPDLFSKGVAAYKTLKSLGIAGEDFSSEKAKAQANHSRPMSTQALKGQSALSDSNVFARGLTPELRKQLHQEMVEAMKAQ